MHRILIAGAVLAGSAFGEDKTCLRNAVLSGNACTLDACTQYSDYESCTASLADARSQLGSRFVALRLGDSVVPTTVDASADDAFDSLVAMAQASFGSDALTSFTYGFAGAYAGPYTVNDQAGLTTALAFSQAVGQILELQVLEGTAPAPEVTTVSEMVNTAVAASMVEISWDTVYELTVAPSDVEGDLATFVGDLIEARRERKITVLLGEGDYTWNHYLDVPSEQVLTIAGATARNGANDLTANIRMDQFLEAEHVYTRQGTDYHDRAHLHVGQRAVVRLTGVKLFDTHVSELNPGPSPYHKSLFLVDDMATFEFSQSRIQVSNDIINVLGFSYARIKMGWLYVERSADAIKESVHVVTADSGWSFGGNGGWVSCTHTFLEEGVEMSDEDGDLGLNCS